MPTPKEIADNLRNELARSMAVIRAIADQVEAMGAPPTPSDDHWLAFPLLDAPIKVTGEFGVMYDVGGIKWQHEGIDFGLAIGTPIYACAAGQVVIAGVRGGYGNCVRIQHQRNSERWWTWYGHLLMMRCKVGDVVDAGSVIAASGNTGNTTGPHLHWTVQREDDKILPAGCNEILRGCVNPRLFAKWPEA